MRTKALRAQGVANGDAAAVESVAERAARAETERIAREIGAEGLVRRAEELGGDARRSTETTGRPAARGGGRALQSRPARPGVP